MDVGTTQYRVIVIRVPQRRAEEGNSEGVGSEFRGILSYRYF